MTAPSPAGQTPADRDCGHPHHGNPSHDCMPFLSDRERVVEALRNAPTEQQWLSEHDLRVLAAAAVEVLRGEGR